MSSKPFEFQNWPVYREALAFTVDAYRLCADLPRDPASGIRDQLRRASQSIPLNIAEGSARYTGRDKAYFFRVARGSVFECAAILDCIRELELIQRDLSKMIKSLESLGRMLSGLVNYVESDTYKIGAKCGDSIDRLRRF